MVEHMQALSGSILFKHMYSRHFKSESMLLSHYGQPVVNAIQIVIEFLYNNKNNNCKYS
jgi:hypothetical protein